MTLLPPRVSHARLLRFDLVLLRRTIVDPIRGAGDAVTLLLALLLAVGMLVGALRQLLSRPQDAHFLAAAVLSLPVAFAVERGLSRRLAWIAEHACWPAPHCCRVSACATGLPAISRPMSAP